VITAITTGATSATGSAHRSAGSVITGTTRAAIAAGDESATATGSSIDAAGATAALEPAATADAGCS